jgi:division protein CdvB (Snf7/Vps24/ESCRT-III family)
VFLSIYRKERDPNQSPTPTKGNQDMNKSQRQIQELRNMLDRCKTTEIKLEICEDVIEYTGESLKQKLTNLARREEELAALKSEIQAEDRYLSEAKNWRTMLRD